MARRATPVALGAAGHSQIKQEHHSIRVGADVGGTFTDVVLIDAEGRVHTHKVPSTPPDYERAVLDAIERMLGDAGSKGSSEVSQISHGTTVATNAVLDRRGAVTALITTRGFRDVLELRRIRVPQIYDLFFTKPPPLINRALRLEVSERLSADGDVLVPLRESELPELVGRLEAEGVESVAVCLLHSYAFPRHEQVVGEFLRRELPGVPVSLSCEVLPVRKEYERTATTAVNAYVRPVMETDPITREIVSLVSETTSIFEDTATLRFNREVYYTVSHIGVILIIRSLQMGEDDKRIRYQAITTRG